ncbi:MAG: thiamine pyrophosphate-dependent enzyme [Solirubrobacteraceae bacterium]|jgi:thiamine pyrophosphate-dependent acetolactate synthase large subunit-like protein/nitrite reductase/ring-hydroxylating ferredoxin subunit
MTTTPPDRLTWHRVLDPDELPDGRVKTVTAGPHSFAVTHYQGRYAALSNRCPHQGGPLGEGSIENGMLRCPWHGYDYCPLDGSSPFGDGVATHPVEVRADGVYIGVAPDRPHATTVSDVMAETMVGWGVRHVFGMVGHSNLGLADALRRQEQAGRLTFIGMRHEGAGAFAASAYGKLTGRPAACLTIAGPGATNLLTGLWDANVDRAPVLALTGQVDTQVLGPGAFQEIDLTAAFGQVARWTQTVLGTSKHSELMALACKHALLAHGPSHLIFPDEVQTLPAPSEALSGPDGRLAELEIGPPAAALERALALLAAARRPVMIIGHGARLHRDQAVALAERLDAPVITTFKAKGQISDAHPLATGVLGRSGTPVASWFMNESDLLLVLGASFSDHTGIYAGKQIIQVDSDPLQLGRTHPVTVPVYGEIGVVISRLLERLGDPPAQRVDQRPEVAGRWSIWRAEKASRAVDDRGRGVNSAAVFEVLAAHVPEDAVIAVDVGNHAYSFGRYFECAAGQSVLMSGYLGSIGFGYPAAIGAWAAAPHRPIFAVTGDGGFAQYMAELLTAVKHRMKITHVLLNNGQLGKISKEQRAGDWDVWQTALHNPDFSAYAEICGARGIRVTDASELDDALATATAHDGPALVEVISDPDLI